MRLKSATRILEGKLIHIGGQKMVLGDNSEVEELKLDYDSASAQVLTTPAVKKIKRSNSAGNGGASSGNSKTNKALCHDLIASLTQRR